MPRDKRDTNRNNNRRSGSGRGSSGRRDGQPRSDRRRTGKLSAEARAVQNDRPRAPKALLAELRDAAIAQAEMLNTGDDWLRLLRYAEHFHTYGGTNALLILHDRPYATRLATYDQWKRDGHPVQRGEHGLTLLDPADPSRTLRVFDISQTGQAPAPGPLRHLRPVRHGAKALQAALTSFAIRKQFDVLTDAVTGTHDRASRIPARTAFDEGTIHLHPDLSPDAACYALAHELAHVLMHTPDQLDPATGACHGQPLTEAESVAYLLCRNAGLDVAPFTFANPPTWAGADPRANRGARILTAVERITTAANRLIAQVDADAPRGPQPSLPVVATTSVTTIAQPTTAAPPPAKPTPAKSPAPVQTPEPQHDPRLVEIHQRAEQFFIDRLPGSWVPGYLAGRGLASALDDDAPWSIGYAPAAWTDLTDHLRDHGFTDQEIITSGLAKRSKRGSLIDRFRDRAMIPVRDFDGTTIVFIGRANPTTLSTTGRPIPKYLNSPQTALYTKGAILYGLYDARPRLRAGAIPVLVEGTLDAIAIHIADPAGRYAPIAPSGTALTEQQVTALAQTTDLHDRGILVAFDGDHAGQQAAARAHRLLRPHAHQLLQAQLGAGQDPAGLLENHGPDHLLTKLANRRPLAVAVIDVHLETTGDHPGWQRRDEAAQLIAELTPSEKIRQLAEANLPKPDSQPGDEIFLPAAKAADLLPYVTKALILDAANNIGIPVTEQLNAVIGAASDHALKTPAARDHEQSSSPTELAARDGPAAAQASHPSTPPSTRPSRAAPSARPPARPR